MRKRGRTETLRSTSSPVVKAKKTQTQVSKATFPIVHHLPRVVYGTIVRRFKRYLAEVTLEKTGETVTTHCQDGPYCGILDGPSTIVVLSETDDPKRKYKHSVEAVKLKTKDPIWVGLRTPMANKMVYQMLKEKQIPLFAEFDEIKREAPYGKGNKSRSDFLLSAEEGKREMFVEVKAVTYSEMRGGVETALFPPDNPSPRAHKHVEELMRCIDEGKEAALVFVVMGHPCTAVGPLKEMDPDFADLVKKADAKGVKIVGIALKLEPFEKSSFHFLFNRFLDINLDA